MRNNLVYQNVVRTFASLKQDRRTCSKRNLTDKVRFNSRTLYREFPTSAASRVGFFFYSGSAFLFSNRSVRDAIIHLQAELKSSQGGGHTR